MLKGEGIKKQGEINFCFVDDAQIKKLNAKFHKNNCATDVLAFNLCTQSEEKYILADIVISAQTAFKQAARFKTTPAYELELYIVHGLLHILGYNDQNKSQIKLMRKKESQYVH